MSEVRPEVKLDLREIINSEGEILFQSMNTRASLHSAKACFSHLQFFCVAYRGRGTLLTERRRQLPKPQYVPWALDWAEQISAMSS